MSNVTANVLKRMEVAHMSDQQIEQLASRLSRDDVISIIACHVRDEVFEFLLDMAHDDDTGRFAEAGEDELLDELIENVTEAPAYDDYLETIKHRMPKVVERLSKKLPWDKIRAAGIPEDSTDNTEED
jgi:hypothetical protein